MQQTTGSTWRLNFISTVALSAGIGIAMGAVGSRGLAENAIPTEHRGLGVEALGLVSEDSMTTQIGLTGYVLQLREIAIDPGGQIARHSHENRPGLVKVITGTWTEGRPGGEMNFAASEPVGILEDSETVHWFWNRGSESASAIVCDIVPAS